MSNRELMEEEDARSRRVREEMKLAEQFELWTQWDLRTRKDEAKHKAIMEQKRRKLYLKEFYSTKNSDSVMSYRWPVRSATADDLIPSLDDVYELAPVVPSISFNSNAKKVFGTFHGDRKFRQVRQSKSIILFLFLMKSKRNSQLFII